MKTHRRGEFERHTRNERECPDDEKENAMQYMSDAEIGTRLIFFSYPERPEPKGRQWIRPLFEFLHPIVMSSNQYRD